STDPPTVKRPPPRPPSGRRRGGQPGRPRQRRPLLPPDSTLKPTHCRGCGGPLRGEDLQPLPHQVPELPAIRSQATEDRLHRLSCRKCGLSTYAELPEGVPSGGQGPRLQAILALLTEAFRVSENAP